MAEIGWKIVTSHTYRIEVYLSDVGKCWFGTSSWTGFKEFLNFLPEESFMSAQNHIYDLGARKALNTIMLDISTVLDIDELSGKSTSSFQMKHEEATVSIRTDYEWKEPSDPEYVLEVSAPEAIFPDASIRTSHKEGAMERALNILFHYWKSRKGLDSEEVKEGSG